MMVKQVKFISWLRADPPNCFPLCHIALIHHDTQFERKASHRWPGQHMSKVSPPWTQTQCASLNTAFTAGHTSPNTCAQHSTPNGTPRTRASNYTSRRNSLSATQARRSFNQYQKNSAGFTPPFSLELCVALLWWLPTQTCTCAKTDSSAAPWALAGRRRWWLLSQLQRPSGFWKKGWAVTRDQEALIFKESPYGSPPCCQLLRIDSQLPTHPWISLMLPAIKWHFTYQLQRV